MRGRAANALRLRSTPWPMAKPRMAAGARRRRPADCGSRLPTSACRLLSRLERTCDHDAVLLADAGEPFGKRDVTDFDAVADQRCVHEMQAAATPDRQAGVGDVQSLDVGGDRDHIAIPDV